MAQLQNLSLGQLLGQAEQIQAQRRQNRLAELMAPIQQQSAQLGLDQARLGQTQQLARGAVSILGDAPQQNWGQAVEFVRSRGGDVTGFEQYSPQAEALVKQLATGGAGRRVQSTYVNDQGQRVAIYADGTTEVLGQAGTTKRLVDGVLVDVITGKASGIGGEGGLTDEQIAARQKAESERQARAAAEKKAAEERAALEAQSELLPKVRAAVAQAEADVKAASDAYGENRSNARALETYDSAMSNLVSALSGTTTGPGAGWLPAVTANAQIAEGAVAAMAPVLKSIFRVSGEGTFTDKDQALLMNMVPTRSDLPEARAAKVAGIDAIVRAKLGQSGPTGGPTNAQPAAAQQAPAQGAASAPSSTRMRYNPATGQLEPAQ